jgi:hypothetical protein
MTPRQWVIAVALVWVALIGGFSAGRFSTPEQMFTSTVDHVTYKDRVVEKVVHDVVVRETAAITKVLYRDVVTKPDGTVVDRSIESTKAETKADTKAVTTVDRVEVREVEKLVTVEKTVTLRPDWRVSAGVGASLVAPAVSIYGPLVIQAQVDRRLVGGLSVGLWVSSVGAAGVSIGLEF